MKGKILNRKWISSISAIVVFVMLGIFFACDENEFDHNHDGNKNQHMEVKTFEELQSDENFQKILNRYKRMMSQKRLGSRWRYCFIGHRFFTSSCCYKYVL